MADKLRFSAMGWLAALFSALESTHAVGTGDDDQIRSVDGEYPIAHSAWDVVDLLLDRYGILYAETMHIEDDVAVVGRKALSPFGSAAKLNHRSPDQSARHGDDFHR